MRTACIYQFLVLGEAIDPPGKKQLLLTFSNYCVDTNNYFNFNVMGLRIAKLHTI